MNDPRAAVGDANAALLNPCCSGAISPFSIGHSFLLVLMWPTRPQFAHFRCVPIGLPVEVTTEGEIGVPGIEPA